MTSLPIAHKSTGRRKETWLQTNNPNPLESPFSFQSSDFYKRSKYIHPLVVCSANLGIMVPALGAKASGSKSHLQMDFNGRARAGIRAHNARSLFFILYPHLGKHFQDEEIVFLVFHLAQWSSIQNTVEKKLQDLKCFLPSHNSQCVCSWNFFLSWRRKPKLLVKLLLPFLTGIRQHFKQLILSFLLWQRKF